MGFIVNDVLIEQGFGEHEPMGLITILEVGPRCFPTTSFIRLHPGAKVVFVDLKKDSGFPDDRFPGSTFVEMDIMDFVQGHEAIPPDGFDYILTRNTFSGGRGQIERDVVGFLNGLKSILRSGGTLILEETLEDLPRVFAPYITNILQKLDFSVQKSDDFIFEERYTRGKNSFHIEATKSKF